MTAYIANHQKKIGIFHKRERALVHAIKHRLADEKIAVAAERVRQAKLSVFKCRFTKNSERQPYSFSAQKFAEHDTQARSWLSMSTSEIVGRYNSTSR